MAKSEDRIRQDITELTRGTAYRKWQIGITNDPNTRLSQHGVDPNDAFITRANTPGVAQRLEKNFLDKGMKGGTGGGSDDSLYIYLFKK